MARVPGFRKLPQELKERLVPEKIVEDVGEFGERQAVLILTQEKTMKSLQRQR